LPRRPHNPFNLVSTTGEELNRHWLTRVEGTPAFAGIALHDYPLPAFVLII
jgi:hypothetical protein